MARFLRYLVLAAVLGLALFLFCMEAVLNFIRTHRKGLFIGDPIGAAKTIELACRAILWPIEKAKGRLADYLKVNHRPIYKRFRNLLLPRR